MLHYDPQHVLSNMLLILRRTNCCGLWYRHPRNRWKIIY